MASQKTNATVWSVAGLLFAVAGLAWSLMGNVPIGMSNVSIGMLFICIGQSILAKSKKHDGNSDGDDSEQKKEE